MLRCLSVLTLLALPTALSAQEPSAEMIRQAQQRVQQAVAANPDLARQLQESAARNGGVAQAADLGPAFLSAVMPGSPYSPYAPGLMPPAAPLTPEEHQNRQAAQAQRQAKLRETLEKHPEVLAALVRGAVPGDGEAKEESTRALMSLGTAVVPGMLKLLEHEKADMRKAATAFLAYAALDESGDYPADVVLPALAKAAQHDADPKVQSAARMSLGLLVSLLANDDYRRNVSRQFKVPLAIVPE